MVLPNNHYLLKIQFNEASKHFKPGHYLQFKHNKNLSFYLVFIFSDSISILLNEKEYQLLDIKQALNESSPIDIIGPLGNPLSCLLPHHFYLFISQNYGLLPIIALTQLLSSQQALVLLEFSHPSFLPFKPVPSHILVPNLPPTMIGSMPLFEDKSIASRICCHFAKPGCFEGGVETILHDCLNSIENKPLLQTYLIGSNHFINKVKPILLEHFISAKMIILHQEV
ncbi:MAG: 2-polyprenylphenol hydroxylase [Francisellaceae bacterium]|nr:2-polyprenylphenol hydroxylase [Francisellaceae bacterium]